MKTTTSSQPSKAEVSSRFFHLKNKENDYLDILKETTKTQRKTVIDYALNIQERIKLRIKAVELGYEDPDPDIPKDESLISTYIKRKLRDLKWTDNQIHHVTNYLDDYPEFKDHPRDPKTSHSTVTLENLISVDQELSLAEVDKVLDKIAQSDPKKLLHIEDLASIIANKAKLAQYRFGLITTLRRGERERKKISTPKPEPDESYLHFTAAQVYDSLSKFTKNWYDLVEKINQYPPTDPKFDRKTAGLLIRFKKIFDNLGSYIHDLSDERYAFSKIESDQRYIMSKIEFGKETVGIPKHPETLKMNEIRKMTRKNTNKRGPKKDIEIDELIDSIQGSQHLFEEIIIDLSRFHDVKSDLSREVGIRRDHVSPKLSESAFGKPD